MTAPDPFTAWVLAGVLLVGAALLAYQPNPHTRAPIAVTTDATATAVLAVLDAAITRINRR